MINVEFYTAIYFLIGGLKLVLTHLMQGKPEREAIQKALDDVERKLGKSGRKLTLTLTIITSVILWPLNLAKDIHGLVKPKQ